MAVFLPMAFVEGVAGHLVRDLAYTVSLSIVSSMFVSLTLVPVLQSLGDAGPDEGGPEYIYELTIDAATTIKAMVFDRGEVDVDLHLLTQLDAKTCVKRDDRLLQGPLQPGTYYLAVDTVGTATPGEFALVVLPEG